MDNGHIIAEVKELNRKLKKWDLHKGGDSCHQKSKEEIKES